MRMLEMRNRQDAMRGYPEGTRLMDGSIWQDGRRVVAAAGSPEAKVETALVTMSGNVPAGRDPRSIPAEVLLAEGFEPALAKAVRLKCLDCATTAQNVAECHLTHCPLWPFRMGSSPFKAKRQLTEEQRTAARARAQKMTAARRANVKTTCGGVALDQGGTSPLPMLPRSVTLKMTS